MPRPKIGCGIRRQNYPAARRRTHRPAISFTFFRSALANTFGEAVQSSREPHRGRLRAIGGKTQTLPNLARCLVASGGRSERLVSESSRARDALPSDIQFRFPLCSFLASFLACNTPPEDVASHQGPCKPSSAPWGKRFIRYQTVTQSPDYRPISWASPGDNTRGDDEWQRSQRILIWKLWPC
jgi:hypothetical protein